MLAEARRDYEKKRYVENPLPKRAAAKRYRRKNLHAVRAKDRQRWTRHRLRKYGLTLESYNQLLLQQNFSCKLCLKNKPLGVDHCHETGIVRGLLCTSCNTSLGRLGDNGIGLERALCYIRGEL